VSLVTTSAPPLPTGEESVPSRPPSSEGATPRTTSPGKRTNPGLEVTKTAPDDDLGSLDSPVAAEGPFRATPMSQRRQSLSYPPPTSFERRSPSPRALQRTVAETGPSTRSATPAGPSRVSMPPGEATFPPEPAEEILITPSGVQRVERGKRREPRAPEPARRSVAQTVGRLLLQPLVIFGGLTVVLSAGWLLFAYTSASSVRSAAQATQAAAGVYLAVFAENEPMIEQELVSLGARPEPFDQLTSSFGRANGDDERVRIAGQVVAMLASESESRRRNSPPALIYKLQLVNERMGKLHNARAAYDDALRTWRAKARSDSSGLGVLLGFAPVPPEGSD
jgi:hypothetical protein